MTIHTEPASLLQTLIRFDTTNPPGNERDCIAYLDGVLQAAGIETTILARDENGLSARSARPNLIARVTGSGEAPPLLLQCHVDVVTTANQAWTHPPFAGLELDGFIWGRGALDMKGAVAMYVCALLRLKAEGIVPKGDIILCLLADEENGGAYGAQWLVENHADQFMGVRYALGEFGGFPMWMGGRKLYPIQIAEKLSAQVKITARGPAGHGSRPIQGGAMAKLGRVLTTLDQKQLPVHITPATKLMLSAMASALGAPASTMLRQMLNPSRTNAVLKLMGKQGANLNPLVRHTVSPTIVHGGDKINVIPSELSLELDGRMLPGFRPNQLISELRQLLGNDVDIEVLNYDEAGSAEPDMTLFPMLAKILTEQDPDGIPVPFVLPAVTDGRFFGRIGIQTYGFTPMQLPENFDFADTIHAADERIPVAALQFGTDAVFKVLSRYRG